MMRWIGCSAFTIYYPIVSLGKWLIMNRSNPGVKYYFLLLSQTRAFEAYYKEVRIISALLKMPRADYTLYNKFNNASPNAIL